MMDLERARISPAAVFDEPADVLASHLPVEEMADILRRWELDAKELMVATEENMPGDVNGGELLRKIHQALSRLPDLPEGDSSTDRRRR